MTAPPPEGVTAEILLAAREAVAAEATYRLDAVPAGEIVRVALEAAAPLIADAEREQFAAWLEGPEAAAVTANAIRGQVDREIAEAVAAERERCAQLAGSLSFTVWRDGGTAAMDVVPLTELLAALRDEGEGPAARERQDPGEGDAGQSRWPPFTHPSELRPKADGPMPGAPYMPGCEPAEGGDGEGLR